MMVTGYGPSITAFAAQPVLGRLHPGVSLGWRDLIALLKLAAVTLNTELMIQSANPIRCANRPTSVRWFAVHLPVLCWSGV